MPKRAKTHQHKPTKPPTRFLWVLEAAFIGFAIFAVLAFLLVFLLSLTNHRKAQQAVLNLAQVFQAQQAQNSYQTVRSNLGFELTYNNQLQNAEGIIKTSGGEETKTGSDLHSSADYSTVNVYKSATGTAQDVFSTSHSTYVSVTTSSQKPQFNQQTAENLFAPKSDQSVTYNLVGSETVIMGGYQYRQLSYEVVHNDSVKYKTYQVDYITVQNNRPYRASLYQSVGFNLADKPAFEAVIRSIKYSQPTATLTKANSPSEGVNLFGLPTAQAAQQAISANDEISVIAKNQPAVVRIASTYCPDFKLSLNGAEQSFSGGCSAVYGSGFIVSPDGYVATNGHVVKSSVADVLADSIALNNTPIIKSYLQFLVNAKLLEQPTANAALARAQSGDKDILKQIIGTLGDPALDKTQFVVTNDNGIYAVQLGDKAVKFDIKNIRIFDFGDQIVQAKLIDTDYDPYDNQDDKGFRKSDVAILKLPDNTVYPFVQLGSITGLGQGSPLTVIGFPGIAENNDLVSSEQSIPSATKGIVSAIRDAKGNGKKLIQSDVSITNGNSGGPAFDQNGNVVGIATYGLTEDKSQGGNFNYMRDVADLKDLLSKNDISVPAQPNGVEKTWEEGLRNFSKAYYTAAIADFQKVKQSYAPFYLANDFIARAQAEKQAGKEATPPEVYYILISIIIIVLVIPAVVIFIFVKIHHKRLSVHNSMPSEVPGSSPTASTTGNVTAPQAAPIQSPTSQSPRVDMITPATDKYPKSPQSQNPTPSDNPPTQPST